MDYKSGSINRSIMQSDSPKTVNSAESLDPNLDSSLDPIATDIGAIETELAALKARYHQVQADEALRITLQAQHSDLSRTRRPDTPDLQAELKILTTQLDELEMRLESRLLSWLGIRQYFWQIARFGGAGLLLGWGLAYLTIGDQAIKTPNLGSDPIEQRR